MPSDPSAVKTAYSAKQRPDEIVRELCDAFADASARVIVFFCSHTLDGAAISGLLAERLPGVEVVGCTSAGEYTDEVYGRGGVAAMAIPTDKVRASAATLARFGDSLESLEASIHAACQRLSTALGTSLRELDPKRYVGLVLIEGAKAKEEDVNEALGNAAPFLSFVGGSAGDDLAFKRTQLFHNGETTDDGALLLVMDMACPFAVVKTCNYVPTPTTVTPTKLGLGGRLVLELDGRPARDVYAGILGVAPDEIGHEQIVTNPFGLMIDGHPWLRSVLSLPDEPGSLMMACRLVEGMELSIMRPLDIVADTVEAMERAATKMGQPIAAAIHFDCGYRRLEIDGLGIQDSYHQAIAGKPLVGLHTHGESWLGHINQTLTCLVLG